LADNTREVQLWLDNEEGSYREAVALAEEALQIACDNENHAPTARSNAVDALADDLRVLVGHSMPDVAGMWGSLIRSALNDIDFEELAKHYLDDLPIWSVFSSDAEDAELFTELDAAREHLWDKVDSDNTMMAGVLRAIETLDDGDKVDIEGTTYCLARS
jgi:hypothetical protein